MIIKNVKAVTNEKSTFRKVLYTGEYSQIVVITLAVGEAIDMVTHYRSDHILFIIGGKAGVILNGEYHIIEKYGVIVIPAGTKHFIKNIGQDNLQFFSIYTPPVHHQGTIHITNQQNHKSEGVITV